MKVAINLNTKTIMDILPDNATSDNGFLKSNGYVLLDIENAVTNYVENEDGTITAVFRALTDAELAPFMISDTNSDYESAIKSLTLGVPLSEISTWTKQELEAREWLKDNTYPTPLIDAICEARECEKSYLVGKIIEKADSYAVEVGRLTGLRQKQEKLITQGAI